MAEVKYVSRVGVEPVEGKVRRAYVPGEEEPVLFGVHSEVAEHSGSRPRTRSRTRALWTTWAQRRAGDCSAPLPARWERVKSLSGTSAPRRWGRWRPTGRCW